MSKKGSRVSVSPRLRDSPKYADCDDDDDDDELGDEFFGDDDEYISQSKATCKTKRNYEVNDDEEEINKVELFKKAEEKAPLYTAALENYFRSQHEEEHAKDQVRRTSRQL